MLAFTHRSEFVEWLERDVTGNARRQFTSNNGTVPASDIKRYAEEVLKRSREKAPTDVGRRKFDINVYNEFRFANSKLRTILMHLAKNRKTIDYDDLARNSGYGKFDDADRLRLHKILWHISVKEFSSMRPLLGCIVVKPTTGLTGSWVGMLGRALSIKVDDDLHAFMRHHISKVHEYWAR